MNLNCNDDGDASGSPLCGVTMYHYTRRLIAYIQFTSISYQTIDSMDYQPVVCNKFGYPGAF